MGDGALAEYVDEDYMVFVATKAERLSAKGFRKILPVQKFLRRCPIRQPLFGYSVKTLITST